MDVARPILDPQHLPALRLVGRDRVVARDFAVMGIVAPLRPRDLQSRRHHRAIDVDRQPALPALPDPPGYHERVDPVQPRQMAGPERAQPSAHRPRRRQLPQPTEALHDRITGEIAEMTHAAAATPQQREEREHHADDAEVRRGQSPAELVPQHAHPASAVEKPPYELQARVRGHAPACVAQPQLPVDPCP